MEVWQQKRNRRLVPAKHRGPLEDGFEPLVRPGLGGRTARQPKGRAGPWLATISGLGGCTCGPEDAAFQRDGERPAPLGVAKAKARPETSGIDGGAAVDLSKPIGIIRNRNKTCFLVYHNCKHISNIRLKIMFKAI